MSHPTKKAKYSGKTKCYKGEWLINLPDGTVATVRELAAGIVKEEANLFDEVEFFIPEHKCPYCGSLNNV